MSVHIKFKHFFVFNILALDAHGIDLLEEVNIEFFDNNGTNIHCDHLFDIVGQKINCGCFWIEIKFTDEKNSSVTCEVRILCI